MLKLGFTFFFFQLILFSNTFGQIDTTNLGSPYETIKTHLDNLNYNNLNEEIAATTIYSGIKDMETRKRLAKRLKSVFDAKGLDVEYSRVPKNGNFKDSLSSNHVFVPFPEELPEIYLEKYGNVWTYSEEASLDIDGLYLNVFPFKMGTFIDDLPPSVQEEFLGIKIWQYIGLALIFLAVYLLYLLLNFIIDNIILNSGWYKSIQLDPKSKPILHKFVGYGVMVFLISCIIFFIPTLLLEVTIGKALYLVLDIAQTVFIVLCLYKLVGLFNIYFKDLAAQTETKLDDQLLPILVKIAKITIAIIGVIHLMAISGVNVTALIAGVSIGGLALALAAQDTVKNFLGSVMIFFDRPFQIGDFVQTPEYEGTVEEVGFRSTRIRKTDTSLVTIPNGNLSNISLTNLGIRRMRMIELALGVEYRTPPEKIHSFIAALRAMAQNHPKVEQTQKFIYFRHMSSSSLDVFLRIYIMTKDFQEELMVREEILFKILNIAQETGVSFAFPSTSLYVEKMEDLKK